MAMRKLLSMTIQLLFQEAVLCQNEIWPHWRQNFLINQISAVEVKMLDL